MQKKYIDYAACRSTRREPPNLGYMQIRLRNHISLRQGGPLHQGIGDFLMVLVTI